ncbi:hypothetical protein Tsubulata_010300 [Turnera subulata]|uniref:Uncharacterized protein n=1 Tax=Turnera subulata TaxID=218843 RepID=A0A9Q0GDP3_9ROSI|nr:hypothetical protein Tsubulata_010300 [Turnera subulata]
MRAVPVVTLPMPHARAGGGGCCPLPSPSSSSSLSLSSPSPPCCPPPSQGNKVFRVICKSKKPKSGPPPTTPPRITSNVKENLEILKLRKRNSASGRPSTSYRRKKVPKEKQEGAEEEEDDDDHLLQSYSPYHNNRLLPNGNPVLLVDGYNVCGYWPKLKKHFIAGRLELAREQLIDDLSFFGAARDVKVVVVFDAQMSGFRTRKETFDGVDVVYTGETSADTWIEREVENLKNDGCPKVWVASSDVLHQQAASGAGAFVWSCKALISEIKASQKEVEMEIQEEQRLRFKGKFLKNNLDPKVVDALKDLRKKLVENSRSRSKSAKMHGVASGGDGIAIAHAMIDWSESV